MLPHPIRLRGGWTLATPDGDLPIVLPTTWPIDGIVTYRLLRPFQWPSIDPTSERLFLLGHDVAGLCQVEVDGVPLDFALEGSMVISIERPPQGRGLLCLEVDPARVPPGSSWGRLALVVASREATAGDIAEVEL